MDFSKTKYLNLKVFLLFLIILLLAYANSFKGVWVLDDQSNILNNPAIKIEKLNFETLTKAAFASELDFPRPVAMLTFALNWHVGGDNILGYHIVNFAVHLLSAFFLFLSIKLLLRTPVGRRLVSSPNRVYLIAFFAALLWALHPIQIQGVTYIVQRMASMSAMFCIIGLYCFLYGKLTATIFNKVVAYILCLVCFVLGMATKENAAVFPCILILTYLVFLREKGFSKSQKIFLGGLVGFAAIVIVAMVIWQYGHILELYKFRFFTPDQRLLTESRILFFYLSQIFWPLPARFSIEHYVPLSTSLVSPVATLFCCVGIVVLIVLALVKMRRWPLISYAILFYFGCHVIESTIMPLELVFEHRNYLPSMFIGLPIVYGFLHLWDYLKKQKQALASLLTVAGVIIIVLIGFSTYLRNYMWTNELVLYEAALERYPHSTRAHIIIAGYYRNLDLPETNALAVEHFEKAFENDNFHNKLSMATAAKSLALTYIAMGEPDKAVLIADKYAELSEAQLLVIVGDALWPTGNFEAAADMYARAVEYITGEDVDSGDAGYDILWSNMGFGYAAMGRYADAEASYQKLFSSATGNKMVASWFLVGLARLQDKPLPQEPLEYLENMPLKATLDVLEFLYTTEHVSDEMKAAWQQIFNEYFKEKLKAVQATVKATDAEAE